MRILDFKSFKTFKIRMVIPMLSIAVRGGGHSKGDNLLDTRR